MPVEADLDTAQDELAFAPGAQPQRLIVSDEETVPSLVVGRSYGRAFGSSGGVDIRV